MSEWCVLEGDCLAVLQNCPDNYFDAMVTDPPAGISMMHRSWDSDKGGRDQWIAWLQSVMVEVKRTLKPGSHCLVWGLPRTSHWTTTALENAGLEVRDVIHHLQGAGFPKSQNISAFIDKMAGAEREVVGIEDRRGDYDGRLRTSVAINTNWREAEGRSDVRDVSTRIVTSPVTEEANRWEGWGSALKPAVEHWILCRKPLAESSIARNVLAHGVGGLNIDGCRVTRASDDVPGWHKSGADGSKGFQGEETFKIRDMSAEEIQERCGDKGRWPPNLLLSHDETCGFEDGECHPDCPVAELDRQSGVSTGTGGKSSGRTALGQGSGWNSHNNRVTEISRHNDTGGASRFFPTFRYQAKPSRGEKEAGLNALPDATLNRVNPGGLEHEPRFAPIQVKNNHPTVKGIPLCRWLCRLICPPGGRVLDPFAGSGSIGCSAVLEDFNYVGIEESADFCEIARARIEHWAGKET